MQSKRKRSTERQTYFASSRFFLPITTMASWRVFCQDSIVKLQLFEGTSWRNSAIWRQRDIASCCSMKPFNEAVQWQGPVTTFAENCGFDPTHIGRGDKGDDNRRTLADTTANTGFVDNTYQRPFTKLAPRLPLIPMTPLPPQTLLATLLQDDIQLTCMTSTLTSSSCWAESGGGRGGGGGGGGVVAGRMRHPCVYICGYGAAANRDQHVRFYLSLSYSLSVCVSVFFSYALPLLSLPLSFSSSVLALHFFLTFLSFPIILTPWHSGPTRRCILPGMALRCGSLPCTYR